MVSNTKRSKSSSTTKRKSGGKKKAKVSACRKGSTTYAVKAHRRACPGAVKKKK